jgi:hypothetical protein
MFLDHMPTCKQGAGAPQKLGSHVPCTDPANCRQASTLASQCSAEETWAEVLAAYDKKQMQ